MVVLSDNGHVGIVNGIYQTSGKRNGLPNGLMTLSTF